ncbi:MAG: single-stranded DNA-binding protein [Flavobacteriales bacterium]|nr:single-stranded DNA-binding protein [Flavobacteriales bacterium]
MLPAWAEGPAAWFPPYGTGHAPPALPKNTLPPGPASGPPCYIWGPTLDEMAGINKVILIGNLGADPEVRHLENGASVANFRIATTEKLRVRVTDAEGRETWESREQTEWHNIVAWRGLAGIVERFLRKGSKIYVEGKLRNRQYQDKDGRDRYITEVVVDELLMLDRAGDGPGAAPRTATEQAPAAVAEPAVSAHAEKDDLPF